MHKPQNPHQKNKAIFLDRDGVLNVDHGYVGKVANVQLIPKAAEALAILRRMDYKLIVISNQSGVARGMFTMDDVGLVNDEIQRLLAEKADVTIDGFYVSPFHPEGTVKEFRKESPTRKPGTALVEQASKDFAIDLTHSFMVGDRESDILCAKNAGIKALQIAGPHSPTKHTYASRLCADLWEVAQLISKNQI